MKLLYSIFFLLLSSNCSYAGGNPSAGKSKIIICTGCHESDGNSTNPAYPKLAGQGEAYLTKQIRDFKSGARVEEHMTSMVKAINESDVENIAAYFSSQERQASRQKTTTTLSGKQIFNHGIKLKGVPACASCHGPSAHGITGKRYPLLAGQHKSYIIKMLQAFRDNRRHNDPDKQMRLIAKKLNDKEIEAISAYLAELP